LEGFREVVPDPHYVVKTHVVGFEDSKLRFDASGFPEKYDLGTKVFLNMCSVDELVGEPPQGYGDDAIRSLLYWIPMMTSAEQKDKDKGKKKEYLNHY
jgi:hypothetical protein